MDTHIDINIVTINSPKVSLKVKTAIEIVFWVKAKVNCVPPVTASNDFYDEKCDSQVKTRVLNGNGNDQAAKKHHYGVIHVTFTGILGAENSKYGIENDGHEAGYCQG